MNNLMNEDVDPSQKKHLNKMNHIYFDFLESYAKEDGKNIKHYSIEQLDCMYTDKIRKKYDLIAKKHDEMVEELIDKKIIKK